MISIKVLNPLFEQRTGFSSNVQEYNYYTGKVVPNPRWLGDDQFCLSTGDPKFPFRVIDKDRLISGKRIK